MYKMCLNCRNTDGVVYCSLPLQVKCMNDNGFHLKYDSCENWMERPTMQYPQVDGITPYVIKGGEKDAVLRN